ncbi:MAG: hypothetical protein AB7I30_06780, partial [Isosphaeraceae bacterium]
LLYLAAAHFLTGGDEHEEGAPARKRFGKSFWGTVVSVELTDIAFSIDSILAAVGMADALPDRIGANTKFGIVIAGGILGILTMRFVAGYFILLLDRFQGLETAAYGLVAWIGVKLTLGGFHKGEVVPFELTEKVFWGGMLAIIVLGFLFQPRRRDPETTAEIQEAAQSFAKGIDSLEDSQVELDQEETAPDSLTEEPTSEPGRG